MFDLSKSVGWEPPLQRSVSLSTSSWLVYPSVSLSAKGSYPLLPGGTQKQNPGAQESPLYHLKVPTHIVPGKISVSLLQVTPKAFPPNPDAKDGVILSKFQWYLIQPSAILQC